MGYAAVASLSHTIHLLLNYHQNSISDEFKHQIISIQKHAIFLESFIEGSPDRANNWEETIREVADRAEDIIELLLSDSLLESTVGSSKPKLGKSNRGNELVYSFDSLERVTEEMESIAERVKGARRSEATSDSDELMEIVSRLRGGSSALEMIAIVGMAGIGKTTLAINAYKNPLILEHFDFRSGYTVSQEYSVWRILLWFMRFTNKWDDERISKSENELIQSLHKYLSSRRYLIVLDDVWTQEALDSLKFVLPDYGNGSRIIITTRSAELAQAADHIHEMGLLDEDKTWDMFLQKIFKGDPCPSQLESVGKMIARSCRGHPLSIQVISGVLVVDQTEAAWGDVLENINIAASQDGDDPLFKILSLSYTYLPHHLRPCFLYLGIWPEDVQIKVSKLVKLWVAEGILNKSESKSIEEIGEERVEDLVQRGLVSVPTKKRDGRIRSIRIHDLIKEVCLRQARLDGFILHVGRFHSFDDRRALATELASCRCVSTFTYGDEVLEAIYGSTIRTIFLRLDEKGQGGTRLPIGNVRLLRILDLSNAYHYNLPTEVFDLFHLRYLAFCGFSISKAISNLENLQTLIIIPRRMSGEFGKLPEGIWRMPQLRHLSVLGFKLPSQEGATSSLEDMQTLSGVVDFICSRENLKMIPNLKKLVLFYSNNLRDVVQHYELHNLIHLHKLETLKIEMHSFPKKQYGISYIFPPTLKKLDLCGLQLDREDMEIVASLPNVEVLKLRRHLFMGETWETSEGGFSQLTYLLIEDSNLKNWMTKSSHFSKLKTLVLCQCSHLFEVPKDIGEIPRLQLIELDEYNRNLLRSAKGVQKYRQNSGHDHIQIHFV